MHTGSESRPAKLPQPCAKVARDRIFVAPVASGVSRVARRPGARTRETVLAPLLAPGARTRERSCAGARGARPRAVRCVRGLAGRRRGDSSRSGEMSPARASHVAKPQAFRRSPPSVQVLRSSRPVQNWATPVGAGATLHETMPLARPRVALAATGLGGVWAFEHGRLSRNCSDDARAQRDTACQPCQDAALYRVAGGLGRASFSVRDGFTNVFRHFQVTPVVRRTRAAGKPIASLVKMRPCTGLRADLVGRAHAVVQEVDGSECIRCRPQIRRDNPLNLSISLSGGKETNRDSPSSCERNGTEPSTESPVLAGGREMWCMGGDVLGCLRRCKSP